MNDKNFDPGKEFEKELRKALESEAFEIPKENWVNIGPHAVKVLEANSMNSLGCDSNTHTSICEALLKEKPEFNMFNISFLLNAFSSTSAKDMDIQLVEFTRVMFYNEDLQIKWNKKADVIKGKITNKIKTRMNLNVPNAGKLVNPKFRK